MKIESNGQLQRIKGPQALIHSVLNELFPGALKMALMNRRSNNQALARQIGPKAAPGNLEGRLIDLAA